ncbi:MAG: TRAP transporter large permease [Pseudomonadota bacterium]
MIGLLGGSIVTLMLLAVPLGFAILIACMLIVVINDVNPIIVAQRLYSGFNSFALLAIPFFLLAGSVMSAGGMNRRLVDFANALVGRFPGGLAMSNIVASTLFSGISGSAVADTSVFGRIFIPEMVRSGYASAYSAAVTAASSVVAPIIPPSIGFIVYAVITEQSILRLFMAGVIPGLIFSAGALTLVFVVARRRGFPTYPKPTVSEFFEKARRATWSLAMPAIILWGIFSGVFTVTECSAIAVVYAIFVGFVFHRELTLSKLWACFIEASRTTGAIMIIVGSAKLFSWILAYAQIPQAAVAWMTSVTSDPIFFLMLVNVFLLFVGTFMESSAAKVMLVPILHPVGVALGVDPIQLGVIVQVNLCLGLITPPIGLCLNVACKVGGIPLESALKDIAPFLLLGLGLLLALSYFPQLSLWLPTLVMG